ncbi:PF12512 family protein [Burkholderia contaminans]|uniref:DUF3717 domain-containing protein n=1 Tax=Burkholderia contaminans TaxID=488447 RepID=UPI001453025E|nr:PF12512 family protein [Burkholderia contaminans]
MNTATILSIEQLERAINIWRSRRPSVDGDPILCREARILADPYALMIFHGATEIDAAKLSDDQRTAYNGAFVQAQWAVTYRTESNVNVEIIDATSSDEAWSRGHSLFGSNVVEVERVK